MAEKEVSFVMALREFFGMKPGQTLVEFMAEVKELTEADRVYFWELLIGAGYKLKSE